MAKTAVASDMQGRRCVITGATSGIGQETAKALARAGAELTLVARSETRARETLRAIEAVAPRCKIDLVLGDLSSQKDVRALAGQLLADDRPIHVLLNNAGVTNLKFERSIDGIETTFAVNHLAYFLLTTLLLDRIKQSGAARIVNVASHIHRMGTIAFDNLDHESNYGWIKVYGQSKLANVLFTLELARRLEHEDVTVNCLHPGGVRTGIGANNAPRVHRVVMWLATPFLKTPAEGAATSIYLASSPDVAGRSGGYYMKCASRAASREAQDVAVAARLWDVSEKLTGLA